MENLAAVIIISVIGGLAVSALILFMFIFPLINRLFKTSLPGYDYSSIKEDTGEELIIKKSDNTKNSKSVTKSKAKEKTGGKASIDSCKRSGRTAAIKPDASAGAGGEASKAGRMSDPHKSVPTFVLPKVNGKKKEESLTISKIDAAVRKKDEDNT